MSQSGRSIIEKLKASVLKLEEDYAKSEGGNKTAGTRARVAAQEMKVSLQDIRVEIQKDRNKGKE